jgi:hypothetical protein
MFTLHTILLLLAALCFFIAACGVNSRVNLVALGLFFCVLIVLLGGR